MKGAKKPKLFEFTSQRKGFERFHTKVIKKLVEQLEESEGGLKEAMTPFLTAIFTRFHEKRDIWIRLVSIVQELDCLISLSIVSAN